MQTTLAENDQTVPSLAHLHLNPLRLHFVGPQAHLEPAFQPAYLENSLKHMRIALVLAALLYGFSAFWTPF